MEPSLNIPSSLFPDRLSQLEKAVAELQVLHHLAQAISSSQDVEQILETLLQETMALTASEQGSVLSLAAAGERPMHTLYKSIRQDRADPQLSRLSDLVGGWVLRNDASCISDSLVDDPRFQEARAWIEGVEAVLAVPMRVQGTVTGIIILTRSTPFTADEAALMNIVATSCGQFLENAKRYQHLYLENLQLRREIERRFNLYGLIGSSPAMMNVFGLLERIIPGEARILIEGESGTGKELVARTIHYNGPRRSKKFIPVDCGALPETLLESELFGHVRGAFTGATGDRRGLFEAAHQGTLFLDEITNTSQSFQAKLLRAVQEGEIKPVGASEPRKVDVRILAATSSDLKAKVVEGAFREDLYYRLNVVTLHLPPLRERKEDIPLLAEHFLRRFADSTGKPCRGFTVPAMQLLEHYAWPGNIREMENVIERAVTLALATDELIAPELLPASISGAEFLNARRTVDPGKLAEGVALTERRMILEALAQYGGNRTKTARSLGITRPTLLLKMKKHHIS